MAEEGRDSFPDEVIERLQSYVYRLIDPRNGETFYVGKGRGNRVFAHVNSRGDSEGDELEGKLRRIREIQLVGLKVIHVIHRHGMDDETATEVEAALIDSYPGLTNIVGGAGVNDYGPMHAQEIISRYQGAFASFQHRTLLINVNRTAMDSSLYEAVRYAWRINIDRARNAEVVLANRQGIIVGAFVAQEWLPATEQNFPGRGAVAGRHGFHGHSAPSEIANLYIQRRVPTEYRVRGAVAPVRYVGPWPER